jgi:molybdate transport system regulatory protein
MVAGMTALSIRIDLAPALRLGPGKVRLLELIAEHGSISAAGRAYGMSYRRAWSLVDALNRDFGRPVVAGQIGGHRGGGTSLTAFGEALVAASRRPCACHDGQSRGARAGRLRRVPPGIRSCEVV